MVNYQSGIADDNDLMLLKMIMLPIKKVQSLSQAEHSITGLMTIDLLNI